MKNIPATPRAESAVLCSKEPKNVQQKFAGQEEKRKKKVGNCFYATQLATTQTIVGLDTIWSNE